VTSGPTEPDSPILTDGVTVDPEHLPSGDEKRRQVRSMFDSIAPRYDLVNRIMSFGLDVRWRKAAMKRLDVSGGGTVVDLACGTGDFCREIQKAGLLPIGLDLSMGMLAEARTEAPLLHADILHMPLPAGSADGATCGFALRNLVELPGFFDEVARVLKPGGRIAFLDASEPDNRLLRWGHGIYFNRVVPVIGGVLSEGRAYRYLPKSLAYLPPWDDMKVSLEDAGFGMLERKVFTGAQLITGTRL
jgi:demethylmenaquinone methyltransferase/2-methoxy-6-polyprenyl-1,4-benzoquinol methylase